MESAGRKTVFYIIVSTPAPNCCICWVCSALTFLPVPWASRSLAFYKTKVSCPLSLLFDFIHFAHLEHLLDLQAVDPVETLTCLHTLPPTEPRSPSVGIRTTLGVGRPQPWGLAGSFKCYSCCSRISSLLWGQPLGMVSCPLGMQEVSLKNSEPWGLPCTDLGFFHLQLCPLKVCAESLVLRSLKMAGSRARGLALTAHENFLEALK